MFFAFDSHTYEIIVASDIHRDGMVIELWDAERKVMLLEIVRYDDLKKVVFKSDVCEIPLEVLDRFLNEFENHIGRGFQNTKWDGTDTDD